MVECIDVAVSDPAFIAEIDGKPLLKGAVRCRRLAGLWASAGKCGVRKDGNNKAEFNAAAGQRNSNNLKKTFTKMGHYHSYVNETVGGKKQLSVSYDCSDKAGRELCSFAVSAPTAGGEMAWMIPMEPRC